MKIKEDAAGVVTALLACKGTIYTFGNGGSASIAEHMACDWMKGTDGRLRVVSLSSNGPLLSAIGNDLGYDRTCSSQLCYLAKPEDVLVLISSSGTSKNICVAAHYAFDKLSKTIGFTGSANKSNGGPLRECANVSVHCESEDYGVIEDYHSQVMHEVLRQIKGIA